MTKPLSPEALERAEALQAPPFDVGEPAANADPPASAHPASAAPSSTSPPVKPAYPPHAETPTQEGPLGIRYDFNLGARVLLPRRGDGKNWRIVLRDLDAGNPLFDNLNAGALAASTKRFYVRFGVEVYEEDRLVFSHEHDCQGREVAILLPVGTLGDTLAWFPYAARFQETHGCRLTCAMSGLIIPLVEDQYPEISFVTHEEFVERKLAERMYATYYLGLFFDDKDHIWQPTDFRHVGLHRTAAYILGVDPAETRPRISCSAGGRPIDEPYVCIAVQSSSGAKMWHNPMGWHEVVAHLKAGGLRVICIDQKPVHGAGLVFTHIPHGAEDMTGDVPLAERARWLAHAEAFVGLSSGLAWLSWAAGAPTVLVSGFTHPTNEFETPFRVINWHVCNSCWNDPAHRFRHDDFMWCPRHQDTPRQFECTRLITGHQVIAAIDRALATRSDAGGEAAPRRGRKER